MTPGPENKSTFQLDKCVTMWHTLIMVNSAEKLKTERLVARISPSEKALIERAAELEGRKVAPFAVTHLVNRARRIIQEAESIRLNEEESRNFVEALLAPPREPTPEFKQAYRAYRDTVVSDVNPIP
jgi:uncharacterized protein (DUF1778 family)